MFELVKEKIGKIKKEEVIYSPLEGRTMPLSKVNDPTFREEMLGKGVAILPSVGRVVAPLDGTIDMVFDTKHAITMTSESGVQILIHVGLETVSLKGAPFKAHVRAGDRVQQGDLLLEFNIEAIKKANLDFITPVIICNSYDYRKIVANTGKDVSVHDKVLTLRK